MNDPFDLDNYKPQINLKDLEKSRRSAYQSSRIVNEKRKQGVEPSAAYGVSYGGVPQDYATEMPVMPMHKRSVQRKEKRK